MLIAGAATAAAPFVYLHVTGDGTLFLVFAPIALALALGAVVAGATSRPKSTVAVVLGSALALFSTYLLIGIILFTLACSGAISGNC